MSSLTRTIRRKIRKRGALTRGALNFLRMQKAKPESALDDDIYKKQYMDRSYIVK